MSKSTAPKGYTDKSSQDLQQESKQLLFEYGAAVYNADYSSREQDRILERLRELEDEIGHARRREDNKAREEAKAKAQEVKEVVPVTEPVDTKSEG